jgi:hypothetical protein
MEAEAILALEAVELRALPGEAPLIAAALGSPFPAVRARAARAAGRSPYFEDAAPVAALALEEDAPGVRSSSGPSAAVRLEALVACGRIGGPAAVKALADAAVSEPAPAGRAAAIAALSGLPGASFDRWPSWAFEEGDALVRREAALAAGRRPELVPQDRWARFAAEEKDERVRWAIWHALARSPALRRGLDTAAGAGDPNFLVSTFALEIPGAPIEKVLGIAGDPHRFWVERDAALRALAAALPGAEKEAAAIERLLLAMAGSAPGPTLPPPLRLRALSVLARARGEKDPAPNPPGGASPRERLAALARRGEEEPEWLDASFLAGVLAERAPAAWPLRLRALRSAEALGRDGLRLLVSAIDDPVPVVSRSAWLRARRLADAEPPRPPRAGEAPPHEITPPILARRARNPRAEVSIRGKGMLILDLFLDEAPHHAASFMALARSGFYDGRRVERGDALSGVILCDARFEDGPLAGAPLPDERQLSPLLRGAVFSLPAAGLAGGPAPADRAPWTAAGSIAIAHLPHPELAGRAIAWGRVALGIEVLDRIVEGDVIERVEVRDRTIEKR